MPSATLHRIPQESLDDPLDNPLAYRLRATAEDNVELDLEDIAYLRSHPLSTVRGIATGLLICGPLWLLIWTGIAWLT